MTYKLPRGLRNNNPLNLRKSANPWVGKLKTGTDPEFEQFDTLVHGLRAAFLTIASYKRKHGIDTIEGIVSRWAPASENSTDKYIEFVCKHVMLDRRDHIDYLDRQNCTLLVWAMALYENGVAVPITDVRAGWDSAFSSK